MAHSQERPRDAGEVLESLLDGNARFIAGGPQHPHQDGPRRTELLEGQAPVAAVLCCSDSRVCPELIFDCGLGDLFVIRVAGNILDDTVLGSLEYAAAQLHVPLVLVLGHSNCGAVTAAMAGGEIGGALQSIAAGIAANVADSGQEGTVGGSDLDAAIQANACRVAETLRGSATLGALCESGDLRVIAAHYDMAQGSVGVLG